jgi:hypothetical protein
LLQGDGKSARGWKICKGLAFRKFAKTKLGGLDLGDVKTVHVCPSRFDPKRDAKGPMHGTAADRRGAAVHGEYVYKAKGIDRKFNGIADDAVAPGPRASSRSTAACEASPSAPTARRPRTCSPSWTKSRASVRSGAGGTWGATTSSRRGASSRR